MRRAILALGLLAATPATAQTSFCGRLGIYDDVAMTQTAGVMDGTMKTVHVGMPADGCLGGYSPGYEFSISGLDAFPTWIATFAPSAITIGTIAAPVDTTTGTGGINVAWPTCQSPGPFLAIQLFAPSPPQNHVLRVHKRFPPSNPDFPYPRSWTCDAPCFCAFTLRGDAYVLNPTIAAQPASWTAIKDLYRSR